MEFRSSVRERPSFLKIRIPSKEVWLRPESDTALLRGFCPRRPWSRSGFSLWRRRRRRSLRGPVAVAEAGRVSRKAVPLVHVHCRGRENCANVNTRDPFFAETLGPLGRPGGRREAYYSKHETRDPGSGTGKRSAQKCSNVTRAVSLPFSSASSRLPGSQTPVPPTRLPNFPRISIL